MGKNFFERYKQTRSKTISRMIALTTSVLIMASTLGIAIYALVFLNSLLAFLVPQDEIYSHLLVFKDSLQRLVLAFLIFGLISSYYMTKFITRPIDRVIKGAKELASGNLGFRFEETSYNEINELVKTYNLMASNLEFLYTNLEKKVQERTAELEKANQEIKNTQSMMIHSERMRSLGQLVAGITHELNNPINFIHGNLIHLQSYSQNLISLVELYEQFEIEISEDAKEKINTLKKQIDLEFIRQDLASLLKSCQEGSERSKNIIKDLKDFSRIEEMVVSKVNLVNEIDTTLSILRSKLKNKVEIIKEYEEEIPIIEGYGGQLNQIFMNIIDNSCYATADKEDAKIYIRLKKTNDNVIIEFEDNGCGMSKEIISKIYDPFYTTKPTGEGSGLGMAISYKVIQSHNGNISVYSEVGKGTKFTISIPIKMKEKVG